MGVTRCNWGEHSTDLSPTAMLGAVLIDNAGTAWHHLLQHGHGVPVCALFLYLTIPAPKTMSMDVGSMSPTRALASSGISGAAGHVVGF